jgi:phosphoribosyl 1,2-cyclic phosphate phosphodiesterase
VRPIVLAQRKRVDVYLDEQTSRVMNARFGYCFKSPPGSEYPPIVTEHRIMAGKPMTIDGEGGPIEALPILHQHGNNVTALGFRIGGLAYSPDVNGFTPESLAALTGLDVWILDALRYRPHPSHFTVEEALGWIERVRPKRSVLTNLHSDVDYEILRRSLPDGVEPAYDGLKIELLE